jgi:hypothetical protein
VVVFGSVWVVSDSICDGWQHLDLCKSPTPLVVTVKSKVSRIEFWPE